MTMTHSHRALRVADSILRILSQLLVTEMRDVQLRHLTLTLVRMSPDLQEAHIYYDCTGTVEDRRSIARALERAQGFMRRSLARHLDLRTTPILKFHYDETRELYDRAGRILHELEAEKK